MEIKKAAPVPKGQETRSDVEVVAEVLRKECPSSTFLMNVGLQSSSSKNKSSKSNAVVAAHVRDLEETLERSELQTEEM
jgi:hypothetical protein